MGLLFGSGARHDHPVACARTVHALCTVWPKASGVPLPCGARHTLHGTTTAASAQRGLPWQGVPTPGTRQQAAGSRRQAAGGRQQALKTPHALRGMFHCNSACSSCFLTLPVAVIGSALTKRICGTL